MFEPIRCPNSQCDRHRNPGDETFYVRRGSYRPKCRPHGVPRFRCKSCNRNFSRQTFRMDYRDHKPDWNARAFTLLTSGLGLRQTARVLGISRRCLELKFRKISRHLGRLNQNLRGDLAGPNTALQLDEVETYEGRRNTRPLTIPILIERDSRFIINAVSATIRPRGKMTPAREKAIAREEQRFGPRIDKSRNALRCVLRAGARLCRGLSSVLLQTDEKSTYPGLAREALGEDRLRHETTNSKMARTTWNPLFPINHTEAMMRDLMGRLRRKSWLGTKRKRYLNLHLQAYIAFRNYVRRRFNTDEQSAAQRLGFVNRRMKPTELLSWRQDWGKRSPHPFSSTGAPI